MIEKFMKKFFPPIENARRRQYLMLFKKRYRENLNDEWLMFKCLVNAYPHNGILECVLMEGFYFGLSEDTLQIADTVFVGGILISSYN